MLVVVRHGRTAANAGGLLLGRLDPPLDEVGARQAESVAQLLAAAEVAPSRIVSSPLQRARSTAEALGRACGIDVEVDDRWIELDYGALDGVALRDVPRDTWAAWRADPGFAPPGGESLAALGERVGGACEALAPAARAADVVVVTHVSPVKAAVAWALGTGPEVSWRMHVAPASITRIAVSEDGPVLVAFDETAHLGDR